MKINKEQHKTLLTVSVYIFFTAIISALVIIGGIMNMNFGVYGNILAPFLYAFAISYILNKIVVPLRRGITKLICFIAKKINPERNKDFCPKPRPIKYVSIFLAYVVLLLLIYLFVSIIAPQISSSVTDVVVNYKSYISTATSWVETLIRENDIVRNLIPEGSDLKGSILEIAEYVVSIIKSVSPKFTNIVSTFALEVKNIIFALFISIYMLIGKETFKAQSKKLLRAFTSDESYNKVLNMATESDDRFGGFLVGKLIDSLIIGIICYCCCLIFGFPFPALISFIIGVTNIIPIAGPFIGAIPSAFLILIIEPQKVIWFILFVLVLQQLDGNFIGPKILGESTGLSSFWVLTSLIIMGSLYGVAGMIIAVPLCSVIYYEIKILVENRLAGKDMPTSTTDYADDSERVLVAKPAKNSNSKRLAEHFANLEALRRKKVQDSDTSSASGNGNDKPQKGKRKKK